MNRYPVLRSLVQELSLNYLEELSTETTKKVSQRIELQQAYLNTGSSRFKEELKWVDMFLFYYTMDSFEYSWSFVIFGLTPMD